jgi:hypothetical protein
MTRDMDELFGERPTAGRGVGTGAILALLLAVAVAGWFGYERLRHAAPQVAAHDAQIAASAARLTLAEAGGDDAVFDRRTIPEIWYRVTLDSAPRGARLRLVGEWTDPAGRVAHRNRYETKPISHLPWETHVRFRLPADAPTGTWRVRLLSNDRELHSMPFEVWGGDAEKGGGT